MQTKEHSLCFTGHRSEKLPKTEEEMEHLKQKLLSEIDKAVENGIDTFYTFPVSFPPCKVQGLTLKSSTNVPPTLRAIMELSI